MCGKYFRPRISVGACGKYFRPLNVGSRLVLLLRGYCGLADCTERSLPQGTQANKQIVFVVQTTVPLELCRPEILCCDLIACPGGAAFTNWVQKKRLPLQSSKACKGG